MTAVHSVTRGWQDIGILLGVMGATQPPIRCPTEGCLVISVMLSYRHFSKTYPRKGGSPGGHGGLQARFQRAPLASRTAHPPTAPSTSLGASPVPNRGVRPWVGRSREPPSGDRLGPCRCRGSALPKRW